MRSIHKMLTSLDKASWIALNINILSLFVYLLKLIWNYLCLPHREQRSGNTLYQELSFQDAEALVEIDEGADITGLLLAFRLAYKFLSFYIEETWHKSLSHFGTVLTSLLITNLLLWKIVRSKVCHILHSKYTVIK